MPYSWTYWRFVAAFWHWYPVFTQMYWSAYVDTPPPHMNDNAPPGWGA